MRIFPHVITPPTEEPVSLGEARAQLNLDGTASDALLLGHLMSAREEFELLTGIRIMPQTVAWTGCAWPDEFMPVVAPLNSVELTYVDADGDDTTFAAEQLVTRNWNSQLRFIRPVSGVSWPSLGTDGLITLTMEVGYEDANAVPFTIKQGILVRTAELFQGRLGGEMSPAFAHYVQLHRISVL